MMSLFPDQDTMRRLIVERLVGATGDPRQVLEAARINAVRALPIIAEGLRDKFPAPLGVDLAGVEVVRLSELKPVEGSRDALVVVPSLTSRDALTMRLNPQAISLLVAALFGGNTDLPPPAIDRPPSGIERDVAAIAFEIFAAALSGRGPRSLGLRLPLPPLLSGSDFRRFVVRDGPGVVVKFLIGGEKDGGMLSAWLPQRVLLESREVKAAEKVADESQSSAWKNRFSDEVMRSNVELQAVIPLMRAALGDLSTLRAGQVIEFDDGAQGNTRLRVRNKTVFLCEFGKSGNHFTIRVKQPFDARQDIVNALGGADSAREGFEKGEV